jgi:HSP90 family molecular chaperone
VVVPKRNVKESEQTPVKVKDNPAAQVQCEKPIWTRKPEDIEYNEFYNSIIKDKNRPITKTHVVAEG